MKNVYGNIGVIFTEILSSLWRNFTVNLKEFEWILNFEIVETDFVRKFRVNYGWSSGRFCVKCIEILSEVYREVKLGKNNFRISLSIFEKNLRIFRRNVGKLFWKILYIKIQRFSVRF